jgi:hypothetical protein
MATWVLALVAALVLVLVGVVVGASTRRRVAAREARRVAELGRLAERLEASLGELRSPIPPAPGPRTRTLPPPGSSDGPPDGDAPFVADRLPGRAALLEAVGADVERARSRRTRLTAVLVRVSGETTAEGLVAAAREATGRPVYAVGPGAAAFTLPALGRAGGLGALARIETLTPSTGSSIEWDADESAVELVARLLASPSRDSEGAS